MLEGVSKLSLLIAAGGTGGHLFPALAVTEQLEKLSGGKIEFTFVGSPDRIESRIVPALNYDYHTIAVSGFSKLLSLKTIAMPLKLFRAILHCRSIIRKKKVDAVIVAGAYLSYPPGIAAFQENKPLFILESNVNPGKTNKMLAPKANLVFTAFEESEKFFSPGLKSKLRPLGNPVRGSMLQKPEKNTAAAAFGLKPNQKTLLVFGGSLGAKSINRAIEKMLNEFVSADFQVLWQTGRNYSVPRNLPENVKALEFIDDMASAYAAADLVVSRSGATTVAELCVAGKPSVLIPLPSASNNEQENNARVMVDKGASVMMKDSELIENLYNLIFDLIENENKLDDMSRAALELGRPNAAENCARAILEHLRIDSFS